MLILKLFAVALAALCALACNAAEAPDTAVAAYQRKDYKTAHQLALPAATAGDANAQYLLGLKFWRGRGVARDDATAARWFANAAVQNHADAMTDLAAMYRLGEGVKNDTSRAFSLLMQAADMDNATAQFDLGQAYQQGVGVTNDMIHARYWLERADAAEATQEAIRRPTPTKAESDIEPKSPSRLSDSCRPLGPPSYAMRKNDV